MLEGPLRESDEKNIHYACGFFSLCGCAGHTFTKTGFNTSPIDPQPEHCEIVVLQSFPIDRECIELGFCHASVPGGGLIRDATPDVIKELKKCACLNGGNAIIMATDSEAGIMTAFGYSQQKVKARATVIFVYPK